MSNTTQILIAILLYMLATLLIGVLFSRRANTSSEDYFIGGRGLGPWVAAMSAEASDMSGWLLMGLPGVAYWCGLADAVWTAIGLAVGTYLNWLLVSRRLRNYSVVAGNAITIPDFFSNRFREREQQKSQTLLLLSSLIILIFFSVYVGSCFVTGGKLFSTLFNASYHWMMLIGALVVVAYTFLGGFWAESVSDLMQSIIMIAALIAVLGVGVLNAGGFSAVLDNIRGIPRFWDFFGIAEPILEDGGSGLQQIVNGAPAFGPGASYGLLTILSTLSWGLGYFGMPQVLLRFFSIRKASELKRSRRIAIVWCVISLFAAVFIGVMGRALYPDALRTAAESESIFIVLAGNFFPPFIAGLVMAGILAAAMSSSDSYLLIAASAVSKNIYQSLLKKDATDKQVMRVSRVTLCVIALFGVLIAWDENSVIFTVVSFAWAGFGAAFGPLMLFSLFWKRCTRAGAIAGIVAGGGVVFLWKLALKPLGGVFGIYELLPAFLIACVAIVVVSLCTPAPEGEILADFERAKSA
jgi:sodium/proline symporter